MDNTPISLDTEFLSYGPKDKETKIGLQLGISKKTANGQFRGVSWALPVDTSQMNSLLKAAHAGGADITETLGIARGLKNVPAAGMIADAMETVMTDGFEASGIAGVAKGLAEQVNAEVKLDQSKIDTLGGWLMGTDDSKGNARQKQTAFGSNIIVADRPVIRDVFGDEVANKMGWIDLMHHQDNHPTVQLMNYLNPDTKFDTGTGFSGDVSAAFNAEIKPRVEQVLHNLGIDPHNSGIEWGSNSDPSISLSTGTRSMADSYLITGGKDIHSGNLVDSTGLQRLSPGGSAHGAGFDAALGASIHREMDKLTPERLNRGAQLLIARRVQAAAAQTRRYLSDDEALAAVARGGGLPGKYSPQAAAAGAAKDVAEEAAKKAGVGAAIGGAAIGLVDRLGDLKMPKGLMSANIGRAAVIAAGAGLAAAVYSDIDDTLSMLSKPKLAPTHIASDRLAMAMALGG